MNNSTLSRIVSCLCWLAVASTAICRCDGKQLPEPVQQAQKLFNDGNAAEAKRLLEGMLKRAPGHLEARDLLANVLLDEDEFKAATVQSRLALQKHPQSAKAMATLGHCLFRSGDLVAAERQFRQSLRTNPKESTAHLGMGRTLLTKLKNTEALTSLEQAMRLSPELADSYFLASEAYGNLRDLSRQVESLEKYLSLQPKSHPARVQNAAALLKFFKTFEHEKIAEVNDSTRSYEIEIQPFYGLMLVEGRVNDEGPFRFLIDTGATSTVISSKLLEELAVQPVATTVTRCVGGEGKVDTQLCKIRSLEIGELKLTNLPVSSFDNAIFSGLIDGVLSTATLSEFLITLDYPEHKFILTPRDANGHPVKDRSAGNSARNLQGEFRVLGNLILAPVSLNGQPAKNFLFDTGAVTSTLSSKQAALLGVREDTPNSKVDIQFAGACGVTKSVLSVSGVNLRFAGEKLDFSQILAVDLDEICRELQTEVAGILGADFFSRHKVTLDYFNTTLTLE